MRDEVAQYKWDAYQRKREGKANRASVIDINVSLPNIDRKRPCVRLLRS